jgi:hypothetical protein
MADKKISELPVASTIGTADISILVSDSVDYQFDFSTLLEFISANLTIGATFSFGTTIPQDTTGDDGDVFLKTDTVTYYQKVSGIWSSCFVVPTEGGADGTLLYGEGVPGSIVGADNDSYIDTTTGIFYLKTSGTWAQAFSMATGPAGPQGTPGTNGANGTNGNTVLNGTTTPSNLLGNNGDFYINTSTYNIYGPKVANTWPAGNSLIGPQVSIYNKSFTSVTGLTILWQTDLIAGDSTYAQFLGNQLVKRPTIYVQNGNVNGDGSYEITSLDYTVVATLSADGTQIIKVVFDWVIPQTGIISF